MDNCLMPLLRILAVHDSGLQFIWFSPVPPDSVTISWLSHNPQEIANNKPPIQFFHNLCTPKASLKEQED